MSSQSKEFSSEGDPLDLVDQTDIPYEERLKRLQEWRADLVAKGADEERVAELDAAVQALETGAEVQGDTPEGDPDGRSYGKTAQP